MPPEQLQYITIEDFRPGIQHRTYGVGNSTKSPPGAADPDETFRCRALPWGGLGPMPSLQQTKTRSLPDATTRDNRCRIVGFHVTGPMQQETFESTITGVERAELHIVYEYFDSGDNSHHFLWERYELWRNTDPVVTIYSTVVTHTGSNFDFLYHPASLVDGRMHPTDPTALGDIFVVCGWHPDDMDSPDNVWQIYPDPNTPNAESTLEILSTNESTLLIQHQGRIVSIDNHVFEHGGIGNWIVNDQLVYTQVNLPTVEMSGLTVLGVAVFTQGPISGYGAAASASAQELLLVKHRGGATTISGDLDDPTVFSLPGVTSTRGALTFGVYTPKGFAYGVRNGGVHVWGGGDTSEKLSINLEDTFWEMRPEDWVDFDGQFDIANDMLLCPNNWVFDFLTESWWRIEDPDSYQIFQWSSSPISSMFYGAPVDFVDGGPIYYRFDATIPVSSYTWQSQYLTNTIDRLVEVREIRLRAISPNGSSQVTVTLTTEDGHSISEEFDVTATTIPKLLRKNVHLQGTGIKIKLEANTDPDENGNDEAAPVIYEVHLGYTSAQRESVA